VGMVDYDERAYGALDVLRYQAYDLQPRSKLRRRAGRWRCEAERSMTMVTTNGISASNAPRHYASLRWWWVFAGLSCVAACGIGDDDAPLLTPTATVATSTSTVVPPSTLTAT